MFFFLLYYQNIGTYFGIPIPTFVNIYAKWVNRFRDMVLIFSLISTSRMLPVGKFQSILICTSLAGKIGSYKGFFFFFFAMESSQGYAAFGLAAL